MEMKEYNLSATEVYLMQDDHFPKICLPGCSKNWSQILKLGFLNPISDNIFSLLILLFVEIRKNTHKNKKIGLVF